MPDTTEPPQDDSDSENVPGGGTDHQGAKRGPRFGVSKYVYYGKHSEGNRFILNQDL